MKSIILILLLLLFPFCIGCSTLFSGVELPAFPVHGKDFDGLIGRRYKVASPLVIGSYSDSWSIFLSTPISSNDGKTIAHVPVGSIIVIDHISKKHSFASTALHLDGELYHYVARFENSRIYKGKFTIDYFMIFEKGEFVGMNPSYLADK